MDLVEVFLGILSGPQGQGHRVKVSVPGDRRRHIAQDHGARREVSQQLSNHRQIIGWVGHDRLAGRQQRDHEGHEAEGQRHRHRHPSSQRIRKVERIECPPENHRSIERGQRNKPRQEILGVQEWGLRGQVRLDQGLSQHQRQQHGQEQPAEPVHPSVSHGQQEPYQQESPEPIAEHPGDVVSEDRLGIAQNLGQYFGQAHPREFWVLGTLQSVLHKTSSPGQRCKGGNAQRQSAADVIAGHPGSSQEKERQQEATHRSQASFGRSPPPHTDSDRQNQESEGIRDEESDPDQSSQQG